MQETNRQTRFTSRIALNGSLNKPEGFLNMLQLRKPHHASLFLLLMAKENYKALLLMISRKAVRECDKRCRNYRTDIESEEHCELQNTPENFKYCSHGIRINR